MKHRLLALPAALALMAVACDPPVDDGTGGRDPGASPARRILLLSLDTVRADHLGTYGYGRNTSPNLDRLAREGVVFEQASSTAPWTLPAHASMLTGLYPNRHGVRNKEQALSPEIPTLAATLRERGFRTVAVVNSFYLAQRYGLRDGFDRFLWVEEHTERASPSTWITDQALEWMREERDGPLFVFLHYYDVHSDYRALPPYAKRFVRAYEGEIDGTTWQLRQIQRGATSIDPSGVSHLVDLYDAGLAQTDGEIGRLISAMDAEGLLEGTAILVTSDHGEEFLEHGGVFHNRTVFEEVSRVPLVVWGAGVPSGVRIDTPVSLVDVFPTVLGLSGTSAPADLDGIDLASLWRGEAPDPSRFVFVDAPVPYLGMAARQGRYKLHVDRQTGASTLFDLEADPQESLDVSGENGEVARTLWDRLHQYASDSVDPVPVPPLTPGQAKLLEAIGYGVDLGRPAASQPDGP